MIIITKINNYEEINKNLLSLIDKIPNNPLIECEDDISHTDWNLPKKFKREYLEYFYTIISPYMKEMAIKFNSRQYSITEGWFQQYDKLKTHQWHTHPMANLTNVYFVELPSKSLGTEILGHERLDLNEGDLLTFPAYWYHRSPVNLDMGRKTVVAFNSNFFDYYSE